MNNYNFLTFTINLIILFFVSYGFFYIVFFFSLQYLIKKKKKSILFLKLKTTPILLTNDNNLNQTSLLEQKLLDLNSDFNLNQNLEEKYKDLLELTLNLYSFALEEQQKSNFGLELLAVFINKTTKYNADQIYNFFIPKYLLTTDPIEKKEILEAILKLLFAN